MKHQSGKTPMFAIPNALTAKNNCFDNYFIEIGGKITSGCVFLTFEIGFKSYTYCSTSKFVKRTLLLQLPPLQTLVYLSML